MRLDISIRNRINKASFATNVLELRAVLNDLVNCIQNAIDKRISNVVEQALIARKGLLKIAKDSDGRMAFVCGQYSATIANMIDIYKDNCYQEKINDIINDSLTQAIAKYLWKHKCSNTSDVFKKLVVSKQSEHSIVHEVIRVSDEEFEDALQKLVDVDIVRRDMIANRDWIELSANGYAYMRRHYFEKEGFNLW